MSRLQTTATAATAALIRFATVGHAAFTLLVVAARILSLPFSALVGASVTLLAIVGVVAVWRLWVTRPSFARVEAIRLLLLIAVAISVGALACAINAPEEDDSFYVPPAVQRLAHPHRPMGFDLEWIVPFPSGERLRSELGLVTNTVEMFWAVIARLIGVDYLFLYHVLGSIVFGAAFVVVYFDLLSRFRTAS